MKAVNSNILVKAKKQNELLEKAGGFIIPEESNSEYDVVEVLSVGEKVEADIKAGDVCYVYPKSGKTFSNKDGEFRLINISEVIVVL